MLQLSPAAASLIRRLRPDGADGGSTSGPMLRVTKLTDEDRDGIALSFVPESLPGDQVGESQGIPLCVGHEVAAELDRSMLHQRPGDAPELYLRAAI